MKRIGIFVLLLLMLPLVALAHSGGTDSQGGHYDDDGDYHYHHGNPAHDHYDMDGDGDIDCPYEFENNTQYRPGSSSGNRTDSQTKYGYSNGYQDGYEKGYADGEEDGSDSGYKRGYSAGERDIKRTLKTEYEEKLEREKESAVQNAFVLFALFGGPVLLGVHFLLTSRKVDKEERRHREEVSKIQEDNRHSENQRVLERISPDSKEHVSIPNDVLLQISCVPVKGRVTKDRPFGEYTAYISESGTRYHDKYGCCSAKKPVHLFEVVGQRPPCASCCRLRASERKVPDWYVQLKTGKKADAKTEEKKVGFVSPGVSEAEFKDGTLYVSFDDGARYAFFDVREDVWRGFLAAKDKTDYYLKNIYNKYPFGTIHE